MKIKLTDLQKMTTQPIDGYPDKRELFIPDRGKTIVITLAAETATVLAAMPAILRFLGRAFPDRHPCFLDVQNVLKRAGIELEP